jgi:general secretion pathway protein D
MRVNTNKYLSRLALLGVMTLVACASPVQLADNYIAQDEWMKAVLAYRKVSAENPTDVEYKSRLKQTELKAADYYYQRGWILFEQDNLDGAVIQFQQGLAAMPDHGKLLQAMRQVLLRKEANSLYAEAVKAKEAGQLDESRRLLKRAIETYPDFKLAEEMLAGETRQLVEDETGERLKVSSRAPITLNFRQTDIRTAFEFIAKSFGIDVVFDDGVKTMPVTLFAKDVTFEEAISLILATTKTFYKTVGANTILIAPDSKEKRGQYEDQLVRVFQLTNIHAKEMADILKGVVPLKKVIINDDLNTIIVRDTEEAIKVAEKVIGVNDRRPAELILEVEILEVNRTKAERLGLDLGTYNVRASIPSAASIPLAGSIRNAVRDTAILTLPSATFNFYKQDVDAKTLANPRLRVLSGKNAKIHIGDRVPLRAATIQDATGQVRTTYDYKDIGIKLTAEPIVHLDNSVTVKIGLEVSSLGQNIGTATEPAYSIGTRNADTYMLLRDGETAILGGLIRDEDRKSRVRVPLLGDIPVVGYLFTSADDTNARTDVLLTITPRVVRGWDMPDKESQIFVSGSEDRFSTQPLFGGLARVKASTSSRSEAVAPSTKEAKTQKDSTKAPTVVPTDAGKGVAAKDGTAKDIAVLPQPVIAGQSPLVAFSEAVYESVSGKDFEIKLTGDNLDGVTGLATEILFNPQLVKYVRNEPGSIAAKDYKVEADEAHGTLRINLTYSDNAPAQGSGVLGRIVLRGEKPGTSYIVYREPKLSSINGTAENVQVRAARVVVK